MAKRKVSKRETRREADRAVEKLFEAREKLAKLEPGGSPDRPIDAVSASVIEGQARSLGCVRGCEGETRIVDHEAKTLEGERLRVVRTDCARCGTKRTLYFRVQPDRLN